MENITLNKDIINLFKKVNNKMPMTKYETWKIFTYIENNEIIIKDILNNKNIDYILNMIQYLKKELINLDYNDKVSIELNKELQNIVKLFDLNQTSAH